MAASWRTLLALAGPRRALALAALTLLVAATEGAGFVLLVPLLEGLQAGGDTALPLRFSLGQLLAGFVLLVGLRAGAEMYRALIAQDLTVAVVDGLRRRAFAALVGAEWKLLARMRHSDTRAMLITTIDRVGHIAAWFADLLRIGLSLIALLLAALAIAPLVSVIGGLAALVTLALYAGLRRHARRLGEATTRSYEAIYRSLEQVLGSLRIIKSFGRERAALADADEAFRALRITERRYILVSGLARAALQIVAAGGLAAALWLAASRWEVPLAILLPLAALAVRAVPLLGSLQATAQEWHHALPALEEARALIDRAEAAAEPPPTLPAPQLTSAIALHGVSLAHAPDRPALRAINLTIAARSTVVLEGPSGAGKSTLADLLGGLLSPDSGTVTVDDTPLIGGARSAWRSRVAYVQQEPVLLAGSVRGNLLWAMPDADEPALQRALEQAHAGFVHDLPGGLDCDLGEAARALSGGEKQRIALARALLRQPDLLILDEATSALDPAAEAEIARAIAGLAGQCTVLVIGHRGAVAQIDGRRIMLEGGRLREQEIAAAPQIQP
ncbi:ATP-binding cassette domain-containing protein [Qipengyuania marisflavi]|uniref:ABC transporter ATP-binding protein n=1 Tax=Qipengyuania marisflavi TaxID=2486356 RepID=A0A5S3PB78_9SPHN|nr:ABC transporter ATP-binding protein [Qipengyuania marisflavi]TMM48288.1 ABC transporter ATP-binding protein [Qipengyuania marisflavi]